jgi:hypothetical protein
MTEKVKQNGGESKKPEKVKRGILEQIAIWIALLLAGEIKRDRERYKGRKPPTSGIAGCINHDEQGHPWVWMEVETIEGFYYMDPGQQRGFRYGFENAIKSFSGWQDSRRDAEIDIQVQARPFDLTKVEAGMKASVVGVLSGKMLQRHAQRRRRVINEIQKYDMKQRCVYLGVKLRDERSFIGRVLALLMLWMGFSNLWANGNEEETYGDQIREVLGKFQHNHVSVRPLSGIETAEVIQHCVYRGHKLVPKILVDAANAISSRANLRRLSNCTAYDRDDMMEIVHNGQSRFAAFMSVAELPPVFNDLSWMFFGDAQNRPVEASARLRVRPHAISVAKNARSQLRVDKALEVLYGKSIKSNVDGEIGRLTSRKRILIAEQKGLETGMPMVDTNAIMIVSGDDPEKVRENAGSVIARTGQKHVTLEIDKAKLAEVRRQTYPGTRLLYKTYTRNLFCDGLAQAMPHATSC